MKHIVTLLFILFTCLNAVAQKNSFFTVGIGYPLFLGTGINDDPHYYYRINKSSINLFRDNF